MTRRASLRRGLARFCSLVASGALLLGSGCGPRLGGPGAGSVAELRASGERSTDDETLGRWLLSELLSPGGTAAGAKQARARLDAQKADHYLAHLGRGLDDHLHGRVQSAPRHYLLALEATREEATPEARLVAWFAATQSVPMSAHAPESWAAVRPRVEALIEKPGGIGWRARAHIVQWWLDQTTREEQARADDSVERLGCVTAVRLAGPFGTPAPVHLHRSFSPEEPGPWPQRWPVDPGSGIAPRVVSSIARGCEVLADETVARGVFYAESYLELEEEAEVILAAKGALALWVDDRLVLDRDPRTWGIWPKFGVHLRLAPGRHRVLARLGEAHTLLRALRSDGTPLGASASIDASAPYSLVAPEPLSDPNDLMQLVGPEGVRGAPDDITRFIAAQLAHLEGEDDVASVLIEPLATPLDNATGPSLGTVAEWAQGDPLLARAEAADRSRTLQEAAVSKDPELWRAALGLHLIRANSGSLVDAVRPLRELSRRFPDVPAVWNTLAIVYGRLGWLSEQRRVLLEISARFADPAAFSAVVGIHDQRGDAALAEELTRRALELDPTTELLLERALRRRDYAAALAEVDRLAARQPFRRAELERRRHEIRLASGDRSAIDALLASAIKAAPESGEARLMVADAAWASGDEDALRRGLSEATQAGADPSGLEQAIDIVEARSDFAPLRLDGREVIRAYERADRHQSATAARVLDYAAVWVHSDGSSRMLEHEIVRIQSAEAISKFAEHRKLPGLVLNMRVIKRDGRTLEPEQVQGKPTVTFPHLEVGDYIETEQVQGFLAEDHGRYYAGMRWFFREEDVAYARSEFVLIAPRERPLDIELTGQVPEPEVTEDGMFVTRRWRVDESPAAPVEPLGAPVQEFLPSVRVGWGNGLERRLRLLSEQVADTLPVDPRIVRLATSISGAPSESPPLARARKAYRWVQENVKDGSEAEGPKVLTSKNGNRWSALRTLLRAQDIPVRYLVVKNRLAPAALGPMSEAEAFNVPLLEVGAGQDAVWLTLQEQYAPFGYVPVEARGMPGHALEIDGQRPIEVPVVGDQDRLEYEGTVDLAANGTARLSLRQRFLGKYAIRLRGGLTQVPEGRLHEVIETRLLGQALPGAELIRFSVEAEQDLDVPLIVEMQASLGRFAEVHPGRMVIEPPLMPRLTRLASLPERQTPLLIREAMHQSARLTIRLAPGTRVWGAQVGSVVEGDYRVVARDSVKGDTLVLDREVSVAAGRVSPEDYPRFLAFTQQAERLLAQPIVLRSEGGAAEADEPSVTTP